MCAAARRPRTHREEVLGCAVALLGEAEALADDGAEVAGLHHLRVRVRAREPCPAHCTMSAQSGATSVVRKCLLAKLRLLLR
eukprot:484331-Rhodomonas_salina.1